MNICHIYVRHIHDIWHGEWFHVKISIRKVYLSYANHMSGKCLEHEYEYCRMLGICTAYVWLTTTWLICQTYAMFNLYGFVRYQSRTWMDIAYGRHIPDGSFSSCFSWLGSEFAKAPRHDDWAANLWHVNFFYLLCTFNIFLMFWHILHIISWPEKKYLTLSPSRSKEEGWGWCFCSWGYDRRRLESNFALHRQAYAPRRWSATRLC